jgi:hypothetical protein
MNSIMITSTTLRIYVVLHEKNRFLGYMLAERQRQIVVSNFSRPAYVAAIAFGTPAVCFAGSTGLARALRHASWKIPTKS